MLPASYQLPAAIVLTLGGFLACFLGYRLFRVVLGIFGFILGALAASSLFGMSETWHMVAAALVGGAVGALLLLAAYFVGVALIGAGMGALLVNLIWTQIEGDPHPFMVILFSVAGALLATWLQRYVIILGTAFGGAWTILVGGLALLGNSVPLTEAAAGNVWVAYPLNPAPDAPWVPWAWIVLGLAGTAVQMYTGGERGRVGKRRRKD
ncbi:MAG: DUF4203 domain-containing protein [Vicinamibacterales bacterium]|nr:DUF4203 domain-containing protein [Vicinamibacterales bacterium]